jgi:hypothetical protein
MLKQKPFPFSLLVLFILIALHLVGSYFSWYWLYPWFEGVVHILAGAWIALVFLWLASYLNQINSMVEYKTKALLIAIISAGLFGVVWELLENYYQITAISDPGYAFDTAMDLLNDIIGGVFAYLYFIKNKNKKCEIKSPTDEIEPFYNKLGLINDNKVENVQS